jgi:hypothetical protein
MYNKEVRKHFLYMGNSTASPEKPGKPYTSTRYVYLQIADSL